MYELLPFESQFFDSLLDPRCRTAKDAEAFFSKSRQAKYLHAYLKTQGCATILKDNSYVDRAFLDDFAGFYVRCFEEGYQRHCQRLHFFRKLPEPHGAQDLLSAVAGEKQLPANVVKGSYLGSIVLKPLPVAFIGRTTLAPPTDANGEISFYPRPREERSSWSSLDPLPTGHDLRFFTTLREYDAHAGGLDLMTESLAFQEQDSAVAACASTAIWSSMHNASKLFGAKTPSPFEVTQMAGHDVLQGERVFPSDGLTGAQMCQAIRETGLEVEALPSPVRKVEHSDPPVTEDGMTYDIDRQHSPWDVRGPIYSYVRYGIPVVLTLELPGHSSTPDFSPAYHAVAVAGYVLGPKERRHRWRSDRVKSLFVHDDGTGPFARAEFNPAPPPVDKIPKRRNRGMRSYYTGNGIIVVSSANASDENYVAAVIGVHVPLDPWIRIKYRDAKRRTGDLIEILYGRPDLRDKSNAPEWDLRLSDITELYHDIARSGRTRDLENVRKHVLMGKRWPKYMWRATLYEQAKPMLELIMDCTESPRAFIGEDLLVLDEGMRARLQKRLAEQPTIPHDWERLISSAVKR